MASYTHTKLGGELLVNTKTGDDQQIPRVAALESGGFVMVWNDVVARNASNQIIDLEVKAQRYDADGNKVGAEVTVNTVTSGLQGQAEVTALSSGGYVVSWTDNSGGTNDVRAQIFDSAGAKVGSAFLLNTDTAGSQLQPALSSLPSGGFVATWRSASTDHPDTFDIKGQVFDASGVKLGGELLVANTASVQQTDATVTTLSSGRFVVSWTEATGPTNGLVVPANVKAQIFEANGTEVGGEFVVNPGTIDTQARSTITALASGGFVVAWQDFGQGGDASSYAIRAQIFDSAGAEVGSTFLVNTNTLGTQELPRVTGLASGGFIVTWSDETGDSSGSAIKAQRFDASGTKIGGEFLVNSSETNSQLFSSVVQLESGRVLFGWADGSGIGGDSSGSGIKAQLFALFDAATIAGTAGADSLAGTSSNDAIEGLADNDALSGLGGDDILVGGDGNDRLDGGVGIDRLEGGIGNDVFIIDDPRDGAVELAGGGTDLVYTSVNYTLAAGVEDLSTFNQAGATAINLTGNEVANQIFGNFGANRIDGLGGNDTMYGLAGNDVYIVDAAGDAVVEAAGGGTDVVYTGVSYTLAANVEDLSTFDQAGTAAINLTGNTLGNQIYGNFGVNRIDGGGGSDTMYGLAGHDVYIVDSAADAVVEADGGGTDLVYTRVDHALAGWVEDLSTFDQAGTVAINLTGNELGNQIFGNFGVNRIDGGGGSDTMYGLGGNDIYIVDAAGDLVVEAGSGGTDVVYTRVNHTLAANVEALSTFDQAGTAAINLTGNTLGNQIYGNFGANRLDGGGGSDTMYGLAGADSFAFTTALNAQTNVDVIADFEVPLDEILLDDAVFAGLATGALAAGAFTTGSAAADAGDRIIYNQATGALLFDPDGTGAQAAVQFATLNGSPDDLSANNFTVI